MPSIAVLTDSGRGAKFRQSLHIVSWRFSGASIVCAHSPQAALRFWALTLLIGLSLFARAQTGVGAHTSDRVTDTIWRAILKAAVTARGVETCATGVTIATEAGYTVRASHRRAETATRF